MTWFVPDNLFLWMYVHSMCVDWDAGSAVCSEHDRLILQDGETALHWAASHQKGWPVVKHLCAVGGKELIMMQNKVRSGVIHTGLCMQHAI